MSLSIDEVLGSVVLGSDKLSGSDCIDAVKYGLEDGYRVIDTAQSYGNEVEVGEAIRQCSIPREKIFIITKISTPQRGNPTSFQEAYDSAQASLRRLRLSYVDLFLIHSPGNNADARRVTWQALERLVHEGKIKHIGVSNYGAKHILEMESFANIYPPRVNQLELHPWCQQRKLEGFCDPRGINMQAYCPLVRNQKATHPGLCALAAKYAKTTQQILVRYSLQRGWTPILRSSNRTHIIANAAVRDFVIRAEDMLLLNSWDEGDDGAIVKSMMSQILECVEPVTF